MGFAENVTSITLIPKETLSLHCPIVHLKKLKYQSEVWGHWTENIPHNQHILKQRYMKMHKDQNVYGIINSAKE